MHEADAGERRKTLDRERNGAGEDAKTATKAAKSMPMPGRSPGS